jgi:serine/threonine protein kinase/Tfp pilus assembly protein PilF
MEWDLLKQIFTAALNVPPEHRNDYAKEACGDRSDLFAAMCALLAEHKDSDDTSLRTTRDIPSFEDGVLVGDRFRIMRFIARGGMGEVFEAFDERLRQRLALKTLRTDILGDDESVDRFRRELLIARGVTHEGLCRVFDYIEHRTLRRNGDSRLVPCLTMELLEGQSLAERLRASRPLPLDEALALLKQIANALDWLHRSGIVHRDLKPSNIMLVKRRTGATRAVITDFGLAKFANPESGIFESRTEIVGGAPYFVAPELLRHCGPSVQSDVYALGLIADEMVTTERAYSADSLHALYYAKLWEAPIPPSARSEGLPQHWSQAILRCLDPEPTHRYASAGDFFAVLQSGATSQPLDVEICSVTPSKHRSRWFRRRLAIGTALIATTLGVLSAAVALTLRPSSVNVEVFDIENQTGAADYEYLCQGMTAELMRRLSRLDDVHVIPLHSPRSRPPERKVSRFSLDGSLQGPTGQVHLAVTLTDNTDHRLVWSESYDDKSIANPLVVESEIADAAVYAVRQRVVMRQIAGLRFPMQLSRLFGGRSAPSSAPTSNNEAFDLYMRGRHLLEEASPPSARAALDYFSRAVASDPDFALAHSALADACINNMDNSLATDQELLRMAREHAERAVALAPDLAEAQASLAAVYQSVWDWKDSEASYRTALQLKPKFARAHLWYAGLLIQFGRVDEALAEAQLAEELDPYDRATPRTYGIFLFLARRYQEAAAMLGSAVAGKELPLARHNLGQVYAQIAYTSDPQQALIYYQKAFDEAETVAAIERRESPDGLPQRPSISDRMFAIFYTQRGDLTAAEPYMSRVLEDVNAGRVSPVIAAWLYSLRGNSERAMDYLERAEAEHDRRLLYIKVNPYLDPLHKNARFQSLLNRLGL